MSLCILLTTELQKSKTVLFVSSPDSNTTQPYYIDDNCKLSTLQSMIREKLGIPPSHQKLYYQGKLLSNDNQLASLPTESNIQLLMHLKGGGSNCEICNEPGEYKCEQCFQNILCKECCNRMHKHPSRMSHTPHKIDAVDATSIDASIGANCSMLESEHRDSEEGIEDEYDISDSPNTSAAFLEASMVMTLAERFNMTRFEHFQRKVISALLSGKDCLVVHPTGSGKSLCFQFPPVFEGKKAIVVTPTISLMQDQVTNLEEKGIKAVYLGSAQLDVSVEDHALSPGSDVSLVFVTPEWISKSQKRAKLHELVNNSKISLIAIDEAHLCHQWLQFRTAYGDLEQLKIEFPTVPLLCLTATAPPSVIGSIMKLLRDPVISSASIDRPNVFLACEEIPCTTSKTKFSYFASRVSELISDHDCTIVYTDFIDSVGPIMNELSSHGIDSVAYYGEMDVKSRTESYRKWRNGEVMVMVATSAFGMGINKPDIRHIIRYGVPENMCSWAQELGRAGRDGLPSRATIFYSMSHTEHAGAWIKGNLRNIPYCSRILEEFSNSWTYVMADLACKCRRQVLLKIFGETMPQKEGHGLQQNCCDVCQLLLQNTHTVADFSKELSILYDTIDAIGQKGEVKITQWIRGSALSWTDSYNKQTSSYGNSLGHSESWWRDFIRKCHVVGVANKDLRSIIKQSQHYSIQGIICKTEHGQALIDKQEAFLLPVIPSMHLSSRTTPPSSHITSQTASPSSQSKCVSSVKGTVKRDRKGKGTHGLIAVKKLIEDQENWQEVSTKTNWGERERAPI